MSYLSAGLQAFRNKGKRKCSRRAWPGFTGQFGSRLENPNGFAIPIVSLAAGVRRFIARGRNIASSALDFTPVAHWLPIGRIEFDWPQQG